MRRGLESVGAWRSPVAQLNELSDPDYLDYGRLTTACASFAGFLLYCIVELAVCSASKVNVAVVVAF